MVKFIDTELDLDDSDDSDDSNYDVLLNWWCLTKQLLHYKILTSI